MFTQSCFNHSCEPSAAALKSQEHDSAVVGGDAVLVSTRDISPGEELTISYVETEASFEERREALQAYGFQ